MSAGKAWGEGKATRGGLGAGSRGWGVLITWTYGRRLGEWARLLRCLPASFPLRVPHPFDSAQGRPLRFLQGWAAMLPMQLLSVLHKPRCLCVRGTRPSQSARRTGHPLRW